MVDATLHSAACVAIETAAQKALRYDPGTRHGLMRLSGQVLAVELTQPAWTFFLIPEPDTGLSVNAIYEGDVTTRLKGSPAALASLATADRINLFESGIEIFGSTQLLIEYQQLLQQLDIDWETALADIIGDMPGHAVAQTMRSAFGWAKGRKQTFTRLLGEYVKEELKATPSTPELKNFSDSVDTLRLAADRLEAKISQLTFRRP